MSKPFMCGDEPAIYIPGGSCECNYSMIKKDEAGFYATYSLTLNGDEVGETIKVPKDKVIESGSIKVVTMPNSPYYGAEVGDYYLDIVIQNQQPHIYISLKELQGGGFIVVDTLPDVGDTRYIYLVSNGSGYDEYVWTEDGWLNVGSTNVDLDDYYTKTEINTIISNISLAAYPVGSLYMSINATDPSTFFGGTWERIQDRFLLAAGSTYSAGDTGGSADAIIPYHRHKIPAFQTGFENSSHTHGPVNGTHFLTRNSQSGSQSRSKITTTSSSTSTWTWVTTDNVNGLVSTESTGTESSTHSHFVSEKETSYSGNNPDGATPRTSDNRTGANMPPYLTVYVWKRTA